jgi:DeoR/GlpR family transcriptional regulator of sugar metabolism
MVQLATLNQIDRLFTDAPPPEPFPALLPKSTPPDASHLHRGGPA